MMVLAFQLAPAQERDTTTGYFLVQEETFTPPEEALLEHYVGRPAMAFMANDMNQKEQYLGDYIGRPVLLWFWNTREVACLNLIEPLNDLATSTRAISIISLADESRAELETFLDGLEINFPIIPNAEILSGSAYAADLGYPRLFLIDEQGIVKRILPASAFRDQSDYGQLLSDFITDGGQ